MYLHRAYKHQWMRVIAEEPIYETLKSTNLGYSFLFNHFELIPHNTQAYSLLLNIFRIFFHGVISPKVEVEKRKE